MSQNKNPQNEEETLEELRKQSDELRRRIAEREGKKSKDNLTDSNS